MNLPRRRFLHLATGAAAFAVVSRIAQAGTYPTRSVRMIVPFPAGNASDILARLVAQSLSERLGRPFIIENRPGAGGTIGTEVVVRAAPDGYALLMEVMTANAINATLYDKLNYDFIRDIAPVASIGRASYVMVVNPSLPAQTIPEFIAYAKANPSKVNMASAGNGTATHAFGALFMVLAGVDLLSPPRPVRRFCRTSRPWPSLCRAMRRPFGTEWVHPRIPRPRSLRSSTWRSLQSLPMIR
jgi:tripartite-type tricarboxylate transporter receptor subunit TctC